MTDPCMCGKPLPQGAVLCHRCGDLIADRLRKIADRWTELEDALQWREVIPGVIGTVQDDGPSDVAHGERKLPLSTGTNINQQAVNARRKATDLVWFMDQIIREDYERAKKPPPDLMCDQWGTADTGERVPCPGEMWAYVGRDVMPDLICNADDTHRLEPGAWERAGWKKKHAQGLHPDGVARLLGKLG